jgi:CRP-like cAMP-binding protein
MFVQFDANGYGAAIGRAGTAAGAAAQSGALAALASFERIGGRRSFARNAALFAEGDAADCWFRVVAGTVRLVKLLADGRRHIAEFHFAGDCFGLDNLPRRLFSAEAVSEVIVMRYPRAATERLIDGDPRLLRSLRDMTLHDLANAQSRMLLLGRMTAAERVAAFLLDMAERRGAARRLDLPMPRHDIADYLGLTLETVCRVLSAFRRDGLIDIPHPHRIELRDHKALAAISEA